MTGKAERHYCRAEVLSNIAQTHEYRQARIFHTQGCIALRQNTLLDQCLVAFSSAQSLYDFLAGLRDTKCGVPSPCFHICPKRNPHDVVCSKPPRHHWEWRISRSL